MPAPRQKPHSNLPSNLSIDSWGCNWIPLHPAAKYFSFLSLCEHSRTKVVSCGSMRWKGTRFFFMWNKSRKKTGSFLISRVPWKVWSSGRNTQREKSSQPWWGLNFSNQQHLYQNCARHCWSLNACLHVLDVHNNPYILMSRMQNSERLPSTSLWNQHAWNLIWSLWAWGICIGILFFIFWHPWHPSQKPHFHGDDQGITPM